MCGILGIVSRDAAARPLDLDVQRHRGPNAQAQLHLGHTQLGHQRLSIIDLGGGAQPMSDVSGLLTIVFNGEIYNYRELRRELEGSGQTFATQSDTEVILGSYLRWGVDGFARLRGMYALALYDRRSGNTVLARDPYGIKPLFWARAADGSLGFASEIGALFSLPGLRPEIDASSLLETMAFRHAFGTHTLYAGVERLEPGMALVVAPGASSVIRVQFDSVAADVERQRLALLEGEPSGLSEVRRRVVDSVEHHTIADVPLGCFLSGGLDSSVVAAVLARRGGEPLNAYSVGFAGAASERSELPHAEAVARHLGLRLHAVEVGAADFVALAPRLSGSLNGPFTEPADIAMLKMSLRAAQDVRVVLSGEGGDEAFAGYPKYAVDRLWPLRPAFALGRQALGRRGRLGIAVDALATRGREARWIRWFANDDAPESLIRGLRQLGARPGRAQSWVSERLRQYPAAWSDLQRMQTLDLESWLPNNLLHRGDYTTMQASLEQRVPLLDRELTTWAVALPRHLKIEGLRGKVALRRAFAGDLPPEILRRPKSGFRLPLGEWMQARGPLHDLCHDLLLAPGAQLRQWMSADELSGLLSHAALGQSGGAKLAWTALSVELWLQAVARSAPPRELHGGDLQSGALHSSAAEIGGSGPEGQAVRGGPAAAAGTAAQGAAGSGATQGASL